HLNILESWATSLSYTFQHYFDFSGYADMAIGLGLMFGIMLPCNFNSPYKALNIAEFWRRWHITLGRFLKECVYIPLGGSRVGKILNLRNLFIVFFLSGIWHGAGWGFVIYGILHGIAIIIYKIYGWIYKSLDKANIFLRFMQTGFYVFLCWFITFNFVNITRIFFRADSPSGAVNLLKGMFGIVWVDLPQKWSKICGNLNAQLAQTGQNSVGTNEIIIWILCAFIVCLACKNSFEMLKNFDTKILKFSISARIFGKKIWLKGGAVFTRFALTLALFYVSIWIMVQNLLNANTYQAFIYFNF
ncbi:MBOAT family O-acyltransferase, partial [Helicobacter sp. T3_23-1059]